MTAVETGGGRQPTTTRPCSTSGLTEVMRASTVVQPITSNGTTPSENTFDGARTEKRHETGR